MMTDYPIIFSAPMIRALLDGRKTMTRRLASSPLRRVTAGDRLWVREAAAFTIDQGTGLPAKTEWFLADGENPYRDNFTVKTRPSIHMPRWASRITLIVTATKTEPLQDISEEDARAEGCVEDWADGLPVWYVPGAKMERHRASGRECFEWLWSSLHGSDSWQSNPFVVAPTFRVVQSNIRSVEAIAA